MVIKVEVQELIMEGSSTNTYSSRRTKQLFRFLENSSALSIFKERYAFFFFLSLNGKDTIGSNLCALGNFQFIIKREKGNFNRERFIKTLKIQNPY